MTKRKKEDIGNLKEEALDRTLRRFCCGKSYGPVEICGMNELSDAFVAFLMVTAFGR